MSEALPPSSSAASDPVPPQPDSNPSRARAALIGLFALTLVCVLWETLLAPLRPGGSWLVMKAVPLALLLAPAWRGTRRAFQAAALLLPFYLAEGIVRGWSEAGRHALVAWTAAIVAAATFVTIVTLLRAVRSRR